MLQTLYPEDHPNHRVSLDHTINSVEKLTRSDIVDFYNKRYGLGSINVVATGDVDANGLEDCITNEFDGWVTQNTGPLPIRCKANESKREDKTIDVPDKTSADLYIGQPIGIDRDHEDYYALMMGVYILGGNFSARLMQTVRDQQGLTYGIGSSVSGVGFGADGYWSTWGTFAPDSISKGKKATIEQIEQWYKSGVTEEELSAKKTTITGAYKVGMDTTGGLTTQILTNAERGRAVDHLDIYPDIINSLSLDKVNGAIKSYINPDRLVTVAAGTFE